MSEIVLQYRDISLDDLDGPTGRHNTCTVTRSKRGVLFFWLVVVGALGLTEVRGHQIVTEAVQADHMSISLRRVDVSRWTSLAPIDLGFGEPVTVVIEGVPEPAPWA